MNILESVKDLYKGEDNKATHLSIFALTGIMAVAFVNITSLFIGNSLYSVFSAPRSEYIIGFSILAIMLAIFFTGYKFKYANKLLENEESPLPTISMDCFMIFAKILPFIIIWITYFIIFCILLGIIIGTVPLKSKMVGYLVLMLLPFFNAIFILFSQNFKYRKFLFNPALIFKIIKGTYIKVFLLIFQFIILFFCVFMCFKYLFKIPYVCNTRLFNLIFVLALTCLSGYAQEILNLTYFNGLTKIVREYLAKES